MSIYSEKLPTTKQFRDAFRSALGNNDIKIVDTKTRDYNSSIFNLSNRLKMAADWTGYRTLRTVTFWLECENDGAIQKALDEITVWFAIAGKQVDIETNKRTDSIVKIGCTCVIS